VIADPSGFFTVISYVDMLSRMVTPRSYCGAPCACPEPCPRLERENAGQLADIFGAQFHQVDLAVLDKCHP
jgi:hypothetical protein